jgi:hypothetical protein
LRLPELLFEPPAFVLRVLSGADVDDGAEDE